MTARRVITLTTDFGSRDAYGAVMKGVILSRAPEANIVDITHEIPPQDVFRCAWVLRDAVPYFPGGTVHVVVVDPGVGTERSVLIVSLGNQVLVAPDNGVLSLLLEGREDWECFSLERGDFSLADISETFHGRDIFAPLGAALVSGVVMPGECGSPCVPQRLEIPSARLSDGVGYGQILTVDHFGNLITNIDKELVEAVGGSPSVKVEGRAVDAMVRTYGEAATGSLIALVGSSGLLEIAVVDGSAAKLLGLEAGAVTLNP